MNLHVKYKTKIFYKTTFENIWDLGLGEDLLDVTPNAQPVTGNIGKLDFIIMKHFCSAKDPFRRIKRQVTDWEKMFSNHI